MAKNIRTRFAPSPTGFLHVGGLRTALYNYLFAKQNDGKFILRIEDTDQTRLVKEAKEKILENLQWAGIVPDESYKHSGNKGPYIQSERLEIYQRYCKQLVDQKRAYFCFSTSEELDQSRKLQQKQGIQPKYNRKWLPEDMGGEMPKSKIEEALNQKLPHVVRMKIPDKTIIKFEDLVRGKIEIDCSTIDDQVLLKSDGFPTYHLAVVVDDYLMEISHVIRGEEWLTSTPKHVLLYEYFGWEKPTFVHAPLLLNPDRTKLSKRQGDVTVEDYRQKGFSPEAIVNFVALLGWNEGEGSEKEIYSMDELLEKFLLQRVGKSGAIFNIEKLSWIEKSHIRALDNTSLAKSILPHLQKALDKKKTNMLIEKITSESYLTGVAEQMKERVNFISEFVTFSDYFFFDPEEYDESGVKKRWNQETNHFLHIFSDRLKEMNQFSHDQIETVLKNVAEENNIKAASLVHPVRIALTGSTFGPSLYHLMEIIGKDTCLRRLGKALEVIKDNS